MALSPNAAFEVLEDTANTVKVTTRYLAVIGTAIALIAIVYSSYELKKIQSATDKARSELAELSVQKERTQAKLRDTQAQFNQLSLELAFEQQTYERLSAKVPGSAARIAVQQTLAANPQSAQITPVIYIQISNEFQRSKAEQIQTSLKASGYQVPWIQDVGSSSPNHTQLRYFVPTAAGETERAILNQLRSMGLDLNDQYMKLPIDKPQVLRPNQFELWFGKNYKP